MISFPPVEEQIRETSNPSTETNQGAFSRWQQQSLAQLGFVNNLLIAISLGGCAYSFNLLSQDNFKAVGTLKCLMALSLISFPLSAIFGIVCAFVRLCDFRGTTQRARKNEDAPSKEHLRRLGKITWLLLCIQAVALVVGVLGVGSVLVAAHWHKLK